MDNLFSWPGVSLQAITVVLLMLLAGTVGWLTVRLTRLERQYRALVTGTEGGSLEKVLLQHVDQVQEAMARVRELDQAVQRLEQINSRSIQHVGFFRFNPFRETGGDQSFVLSLADGSGNGAVLSTLHCRDITRVYAKPLESWQSPYPLTDEEKQAIRRTQDAGPANGRNGH